MPTIEQLAETIAYDLATSEFLAQFARYNGQIFHLSEDDLNWATDQLNFDEEYEAIETLRDELTSLVSDNLFSLLP